MTQQLGRQRVDQWLRPQLCNDALRMGRVLASIAPQAAIVACHATASTPDDTDWPRIVGLYTELTGLVRSPIIELNHAVAVGMAEGSDVALAIVDGLLCESALRSQHLLSSVWGDLLHKPGGFEEARAAFETAAALAGNTREQDLMRRRAAEAARAAASS